MCGAAVLRATGNKLPQDWIRLASFPFLFIMIFAMYFIFFHSSLNSISITLVFTSFISCSCLPRMSQCLPGKSARLFLAFFACLSLCANLSLVAPASSFLGGPAGRRRTRDSAGAQSPSSSLLLNQSAGGGKALFKPRLVFRLKSWETFACKHLAAASEHLVWNL